MVYKIMFFLLIISILIVIKETLSLFSKIFIKDDYIRIGIGRQIAYAIAISYIITIIFTGFSLT